MVTWVAKWHYQGEGLQGKVTFKSQGIMDMTGDLLGEEPLVCMMVMSNG